MNGPHNSPGDDRVAAAGQVADHRQDHDRADDVVAEIGDAAGRPARGWGVEREAGRDPVAEAGEGQHDEQRVDPVEKVRDILEQFLDRTVSERHEQENPGRQRDRAGQHRQPEHRRADRAGGGAVDGEDQDDEEQVDRLERDPAGAEQRLEEALIVARRASPARTGRWRCRPG